MQQQIPGYKDDFTCGSTTLPSSMALVAHNQIQDGPLDPKEKASLYFLKVGLRDGKSSLRKIAPKEKVGMKENDALDTATNLLIYILLILLLW